MGTRAKPNIIWIMSDDLAWQDMGCYGQDLIRTPHLDRMAAEGTRYTHCYSGSTICAPSRSSLMQGLHQGHASVRDNMHKFSGGQFRPSLLPGDTTVAQVLKDAGYTTGLFGKWGVALHDQPGLPNDAGFDAFYGYLNQRKAHSYYPEYLWHNKQRVDLPENAGHNHREPNEYDADGKIIPNGVADPRAAKYSYDLYHQRALDFIREHAEEPFFLYLAYTLPHGVHEVPDLGPYKDKDWPLQHKVYAAMVSLLDQGVGDVLGLLKELKLDEDTLVVFVSDNGYSFEGTDLDQTFHHRGPYKGQKGHLHQGGLRVPAIARWPGVVEAGATSDQVWAFWDFLPTAAEIAGTDTPAATDGLSMLPTLTGKGEQPQHDHLYWEYRDEQAARIGKYWVYRAAPGQPIQIWDADDDPAQEKDLAVDMPDLVTQADQLFRDAHTPSPQTPSPGEDIAEWEARARAAGIRVVHNVDT